MWDKPYLFKVSLDGLISRRVAGEETKIIMWHFHNLAYGGHHSGERATTKVLQYGFGWPTLFKDCKQYVEACPKFQMTSNISKRDEITLHGILDLNPFDCWGMNFKCPFPSSHSHQHIIRVLICDGR